jgi:hypothetical protein
MGRCIRPQSFDQLKLVIVCCLPCCSVVVFAGWLHLLALVSVSSSRSSSSKVLSVRCFRVLSSIVHLQHLAGAKLSNPQGNKGLMGIGAHLLLHSTALDITAHDSIIRSQADYGLPCQAGCSLFCQGWVPKP